MSHTLWVLDFDRCLGDIDILYSSLEKIIDATGSESALEMREAKKKVEQSGGSFNALAMCKERLSDERYRRLLDAYQDESFSAGHFLLPGAKRFLDWLHETGQPYMIMTYGDADWQFAKLKRAGLGEVAYMITADPRKVETLSKWFTGQGVEVPLSKIANSGNLPSFAEEVVLVDDKAKAFNGTKPSGLRGYWLQHSPLVASQMGEVSDGVTIVQSFDSIIEAEAHIA